MHVTVVGEVVIDRFFHADGSVIDVAGGSSANTAIALQRSGIDTALRARFSIDAAGRALKAHNSAEGLDLDGAPNAQEPASIVEVRLATDGQPSYVFRLTGAADWQWTDAELATPLPPGTQLVHFGSIAAVWQPGAGRMRAWVSSLQPRPLISFDPNARPAAASNEAEAQQMRDGIEAWVRIADFVKVSDEDLRWIAPGTSEDEKAASWSELTNFVVMTRGADGASVFVDGHRLFDVSGVETDVVDTVGAGDTFMAWLIRGVLLALETQALTELAHNDALLRDIVSLAARAAAVTVSRRGCNPPTLADL